MRLNNLLIKTLKEKKLSLAFAESMTCGLAVQKLSACKDVSDVLKGSITCYTAEVKTGLLKVDRTLIDRYTCESQEVTTALAKNLSKIIKADVCVGITGLASEGGTETQDKPVGTVFFSIKYKNKLFKERKLFKGSPAKIREKACNTLYKFILETIKKT